MTAVLQGFPLYSNSHTRQRHSLAEYFLMSFSTHNQSRIDEQYSNQVCWHLSFRNSRAQINRRRQRELLHLQHFVIQTGRESGS